MPDISIPFITFRYVSFKQLSNYSVIFWLVCFKAYLEEFFVSLALCHTVQVSIPTSNKREQVVSLHPGYVNNTFNPDHFDYTYQASSPDEKALVEACRR